MDGPVLLLDGRGRHVGPTTLADAEGDPVAEVGLVVVDGGVGGGMARNRTSHQVSGGSVGIRGGVGGLLPDEGEGQQGYEA